MTRKSRGVTRNDDGTTGGKDGRTPPGQDPPPGAKSRAAEDREARLAAALRENLRRRKKGRPAGKPD